MYFWTWIEPGLLFIVCTALCRTALFLDSMLWHIIWFFYVAVSVMVINPNIVIGLMRNPSDVVFLSFSPCVVLPPPNDLFSKGETEKGKGQDRLNNSVRIQ